MIEIDTSKKADIKVVTGSSGSGKSAWTKQHPDVKKTKRLIVWDIDDEYGEIPQMKTFYSVPSLAAAIKESPRGRFRFVGEFADFNLFCKVVFAWGACTVIIEELAGVTSPNKAPQGWHTLVSRGRKRGITIFAITQRPAESDKTVMGNASLVHCGRMQRAKDQRYMSDEMNLPLHFIQKLRPLEYVEVTDAGDYFHGKVTFNGRKVHKSLQVS